MKPGGDPKGGKFLGTSTETTIRSLDPAAVLADLQFSLVVCSTSGVQVVGLDVGEPVVLGRQAPATLLVNDPGLSRQHARFELVGEDVWVEDLKSTNGTFVNGTRVARARVMPRDEVTIGAISISLRLTPRLEQSALGLETHDVFQTLLKHEVSRALGFVRKVSLLMIRAGTADVGRFAHWCTTIGKNLQPADRAALYGPDTVEILLPERDHQAADRIARDIVADGARNGVALNYGVACYPDDAASAEEMIEVSRSTIRRTKGLQIAPSNARQSVAVTLNDGEHDSGPLVRSRPMIEVYATVKQLAESKIPVLILGETGTGKEVVARAIAESGARRGKPFSCLNCGAIPEQLVEGTLFGHVRGAFTGADRDKKGMFEEAHTGTLLLDEIGDLPLPAQAALLRVLETKRVTRVGSSKEIEVDVRILAATNRNLEEMSATGKFRLDLLFRLNTMTLKLPPLRERREEIQPLAEYFMRLANEDNDCRVKHISREAHSLLMAYDWPGNVRELKNVIERAVVVAQGGMITPVELPDRIHARPRVADRSLTPIATHVPLTGIPVAGGPTGPHSTVDVTTGNESEPTIPVEAFTPVDEAPDLKSLLQKFEVTVIEDALARTSGNQSLAAELLGMPRRTLVHKIKTYHIERKPSAGSALPRSSTVMLGPDGRPLDFRTQLDRYEESIIQKALESVGGDLALAARRLGVTEVTLAKKTRR